MAKPRIFKKARNFRVNFLDQKNWVRNRYFETIQEAKEFIKNGYENGTVSMPSIQELGDLK